jgi:hypothetical protein
MWFTAHTPNGKAEPLKAIPNYNFEWQIPYRREPGQERAVEGDLSV